VTSGFRSDVTEICAASNGNNLPTFRENLSAPYSRVEMSKDLHFLEFLTLEVGTDRLSRNVGKNYKSTKRNISEQRRSELG
jgi:hypothetical protein